jgi:hypothetical protein
MMEAPPFKLRCMEVQPKVKLQHLQLIHRNDQGLPPYPPAPLSPILARERRRRPLVTTTATEIRRDRGTEATGRPRRLRPEPEAAPPPDPQARRPPVWTREAAPGPVKPSDRPGAGTTRPFGAGDSAFSPFAPARPNRVGVLRSIHRPRSDTHRRRCRT